ncbi:MAG: hypothetical protein ACE15D_03820 [Candidatus Eisenbacteria bacterium]|nr:hypothetical protein [Candidatus Eisenbacteria bacterium]
MNGATVVRTGALLTFLAGLFPLIVPALSPATAAAPATGAGPANAARAATVWLEATIEEQDGDRTTIRGPLEWLATAREGRMKIEFERMRIRPARLFERYRDLPAGESRLVARDVNEEGEPYHLDVVSRPSEGAAATGRIHLLVDDGGKRTDVRFPLSAAKVLEVVGDILPDWIRLGPEERSKASSFDRRWDIGALLTYGPFELVDSRGPRGSAIVRVE